MHHSPTHSLTHYSPELLLPLSSQPIIRITPQNSISQHPSEVLRLPLILPFTDQSETAYVTGLIPPSNVQNTSVLSRPQVLGLSQLAPYTLSAMMPHMAPSLPSTQQPIINTQVTTNCFCPMSTQLPPTPQPLTTNQPPQNTSLPSTDELPANTQIIQLATHTKLPSTEPPSAVMRVPSHDESSQTTEQQTPQWQPTSNSEELDPQLATFSSPPSLPPAAVSVPVDPLRKLSEQGSVLEESGVGLSLPKDASEKEAGKSPTAHPFSPVSLSMA